MFFLKHGVDALTHWAQEWQLGISVDKCCVLNIGTEITAPPRLFLDNCALNVLTQTRDLGICREKATLVTYSLIT